MAQLVTRVSDELIAQVDGLVAQGLIESRSDAVRTGLRQVVDDLRRRQVADAIVAGYRAYPQTADEIGWPDEATVAMIVDQPW